MFADQQLGAHSGLALGTVDGRGVGELDVITRIVRGQNALSVLPGDGDPSVDCDVNHRPRIAVGDLQLAVVATRRDSIVGTDPLPG